MKWLNKYVFSVMIITAMPAFLGGCGKTVAIPTVFNEPLIITGESLNTMGQLFVMTGNAMNRGLEAKQVTGAQYNKWRDFALDFKVKYPKAVALWKKGVALNDAVAQQDAGIIISGLAVDLATYMNLILPHKDA